MMGPGLIILSSSLQIVALLFLVIATPLSCQLSAESAHSRLSFLIATSNNESGVEITVFLDNPHYSGLVASSYLIPDQSLPSYECGAHYFRCPELLQVETSLPQDNREVHVLFVPLKNGLAILTHDQSFVNSSDMATGEWHTFVVDNLDCSPSVIYKVEGSFFTVCVKFTSEQIAVYEIRLNWNKSQLEEAVFNGPLTDVPITNLLTSYLSNFVVEVSSGVHKIYFAVDDVIFVMDVIDPTQTKRFPGLPQCRQVHKLTSVYNDQQLIPLAYCNDRYIYFDPVYGDWTAMCTYSTYGIPYPCPNNDYKVSFFSLTDGDFLQFTVGGSIQTVIDNTNVSSGICFEIGSKAYFIWSDPQNNSVFVFDFITQIHYPVSPYDCSSTADCPQLLLLENQYIVVRYDDNILVIDAENGFDVIIYVSQASPNILTFFTVNILSLNNGTYTTSNISSSTTTSTISPSTTTSMSLLFTTTNTNSPSTTTSTISPSTTTSTISPSTTTGLTSLFTTTNTNSPSTTTSTISPSTTTSTISPSTTTGLTSLFTTMNTNSPSTTTSTISPSTATSTISPSTTTGTISSSTTTSMTLLFTTTNTISPSTTTSTSSPSTNTSTISPSTTTGTISSSPTTSVTLLFTTTNTISPSTTTGAISPSTTTSAQAIHSSILTVTVLPITIIIITLLLTVLLVYRLAKKKWCNIYRLGTMRPRLTNYSPMPSEVQSATTLSVSDDDEDEEGERIEMQNLYAEGWKKITTV